MSPAEPSTAKGAATRAHLLSVAAQAFAERGYNATKFTELIDASGLTKGAFYFYFRSKSDLALAVINDQEARWVDHVQRRVLAHATPVEQLMDVIPAMLDLIEQDPGAWSLVRLVRELVATGDVAPDVVKPVSRWIDLLAGIIRSGQAAGEIRAHVDPEGLATVLVGSFDGIKTLVDTTSGDRSGDLARYADILGTLAFGGLTESHTKD